MTWLSFFPSSSLSMLAKVFYSAILATIALGFVLFCSVQCDKNVICSPNRNRTFLSVQWDRKGHFLHMQWDRNGHFLHMQSAKDTMPLSRLAEETTSQSSQCD